MPEYQHRWQSAPAWKGDTGHERCLVCGVTKRYTPVPGWPGVTEYTPATGEFAGEYRPTEPRCVALPVDGLFKPAPEPASVADGCWYHGKDRDGAEWRGPFRTREECILDGQEFYETSFWIDEATPNDPYEMLDWFASYELPRMAEAIGDYLYINPSEVTIKPGALRELLLWAQKYVEVGRHYELSGTPLLLTRLPAERDDPEEWVEKK